MDDSITATLLEHFGYGRTSATNDRSFLQYLENYSSSYTKTLPSQGMVNSIDYTRSDFSNILSFLGR